LPLTEDPERFVSGNGSGHSPGADLRRLQMPQGAVADVRENHVGATGADHYLDRALAVQRFILYELANPAFRVRDHDPFSFAKMRRHLLVSAIRRHHHSNFRHYAPHFDRRHWDPLCTAELQPGD
jgi:hypothetical protein